MIKTLLVSIIALTCNSSDYGMIAFFEDECPKGWEYYSNLTGKVAVGQGASYDLLQTGGEESHTLTINEMPNHNHDNGLYNRLLASNCQGTSAYAGDYTCGEPDIFSSGMIASQGGSQAHNNMQPYLVLLPCIKKYDQEIETLQSRVIDLENDVSTKKAFWVWNLSNSIVIVVMGGCFFIRMRRNDPQYRPINIPNVPNYSGHIHYSNNHNQ